MPVLGPAQQAEDIRRHSAERYTLPVPLVEERLKTALRRAEALYATSHTASTDGEAAAADEPAGATKAGKNGSQSTAGPRKDRGRKSEQARKKPGGKAAPSPPSQGSIVPMELVGSLPGADGDQETREQ